MAPVKFNVCGVVYTIEKSFLDSGPVSKLTKMCANDESTREDTVFVIQRPPDLFHAMLTLYLTGNLHIPMTSCPGAFLKEMEFWEIDPKYLSNCCFYRLQCHLEEQRTLIKFHQHIVGNEEDTSILVKGLAPTIATLRARVWSIVDYRGRCLLDKMYFSLTFLMILLSIMTISLGTCDMFRRNMTNCERLEFMEATQMEHIDIFAGLISGHSCHNSTIPDINQGPQGLLRSDSYLQEPDDGKYAFLHLSPDTETVTEDYNRTVPLLLFPSNVISVKIPNMKVRIRILVVLDLVTLAFFTIDFILRLLSCPSIFSYFKSVINILDTAALVGSYLHLVLLEVHGEERYQDELIDVLALMQMLRAVRLLRIVRNITAARVLVYTFRQNVKDLSILLLFLIVGICIFSSLMYTIENKNAEQAFDNVPIGWYWALITMTTVGYGDIYPISVPGKVVACVCAIAGLLLFALTVPIFANHFLSLYQYANLKCFSKLNCKDTVVVASRADLEKEGRVISMVIDQRSEMDTSISQIESEYMPHNLKL